MELKKIMIWARLIFFAVLFLPVSAYTADDWPALRGSPEGQARLAWSAPDSSQEINEWGFTSKGNRRYKTGLAVWASPALAVVNGKPMAFIGGYDQTMHGLDLLSKKQIWFKLTNGEIGNSPAVGEVDGRPIVFWGSADRTVYAAVAESGERWWTRELETARNTMGDVTMSSPLLHDGTLYITCFIYDKSLAHNEQKGWLYALRMTDGEILWRIEVSQGPVSSPAGCEIKGKYYTFVAARKGLLQAFDVSSTTPKRIWTYQMPHEVLGSPAIDTRSSAVWRTKLFLGSKFGNLIAIDAYTGKECWKRMAGNWIDNSACVGELGGRSVVFVGSHDYFLYAFNADDGELIWKVRLGGEVHSAPAFFNLEGKPALIAGCLDNHLYLVDAERGSIITSFYTGKPIWDKVSKGENLWGSPAVLEAGKETAVIYGSFNDTVYVIPLLKPCSLQAMVRSKRGLWLGLAVVAFLFLAFVLPIVIHSGKKLDRKIISAD